MIPHCSQCGRKKRQQRLFPTHLHPSTPINRNTSRKPSSNSVLLDQVIHIEPIDDDRSAGDSLDKRFQRVPQMIYLRENINNSTYREIHIPSDYVVLKRLEENNAYLSQNRLKVDHHFRPLQLQYQTMNQLIQNVPITTSIFSKPDTVQIEVHPRTNSSADTTSHPPSLSRRTATDDTLDSSVSSSMSLYEQEHCSRNINQSSSFINNHPKSTVETSVSVSVKKHNEIIADSFVQTEINNNVQFLPWPYNTNCHYDQTSFPTSPFTEMVYPQMMDAREVQSPSPSQKRSIQCNETINKIKEILNLLEKYLPTQSIHPLTREQRVVADDKSISTNLTSDSLRSTYSMPSISDLSFIEFDSLNYSDANAKHRARLQRINRAKNSNCYRQTSEDQLVSFLPSIGTQTITVFCLDDYTFCDCSLHVSIVHVRLTGIHDDVSDQSFFYLGSLCHDPARYAVDSFNCLERKL